MRTLYLDLKKNETIKLDSIGLTWIGRSLGDSGRQSLKLELPDHVIVTKEKITPEPSSKVNTDGPNAI